MGESSSHYTQEGSVLNWEIVRRRYRACRELAYFYTAGFGLIHDNVYLAYSDYLNDIREKTKVQWPQSRAMREDCRAAVASLIDCGANDVGFTPNTSHGMNLLAMMIAEKSRGDSIITAADDFPSTVIPWQHHGFKVTMIPSRAGRISIEDILKSVTAKTAAVAISHVQFISGFRLDIVSLGRELASRGIPFLVNATQSLGVFPFSVRDARISAMTASCHKWLGAGYSGSIFYVSPSFRKGRRWPLAGWFSVDDPLMMKNAGWTLRSQTAAVETGVIPFAPIAAILQAITIVQELGIYRIAERVLELTDYLLQKLSPYRARMITPRDQRLQLIDSVNSGIVSLKVPKADEIVAKLAHRNIVTSSPRGFLRFAVHHYNTYADIDRLVAALSKMLPKG